MKRVVIYRIIAIVAIVILILTILMATTKMPNEKKNGFIRKFSTDEVMVLKSAPVDPSIAKIIGMSENTIFLGGENPFATLMLNKDLVPTDTLLINLNVPSEKLVPFSIKIDSPWIYLHVNNLKSVVHGKFPGQKLNMTELKSTVFTKSVQISQTSCIVKTISSSMNKQILQKIDIETGAVTNEVEVTAASDGLGWLSSDGMLEYNQHLGRLVYVEYLRNRFLCLDSNLNIIYKGRTIDTISINEIKLVKETEGGGKVKMVPSGARIKVNKDCFSDNKYIYILSALRADNESIRNFKRNAVIDAYDIFTGRYAFSFYLSHDPTSLRSVIKKNDTLVALFEKEIFLYRLNH